MLRLTPQSRVFIAREPADFRRGIDGLAALCRQRLGEDPMAGAIFVFRNRRGTSLKLLCWTKPLRGEKRRRPINLKM
jgi:transposase